MKLVRRFDVLPVPAPRQVRSDAWRDRPCVLRYRQFRDDMREQAGDWQPSESGLWVLFALPMPKSWSKKKKAEMAVSPHQQKPDTDNLLKAFLDCFGEDCRVWDERATKVWSAGPGWIAVLEMDEPPPIEAVLVRERDRSPVIGV